jgi:hypothetical protein
VFENPQKLKYYRETGCHASGKFNWRRKINHFFESVPCLPLIEGRAARLFLAPLQLLAEIKVHL